MTIRPFRRSRRGSGKASFGNIVAAIAVTAFGVTLFWPRGEAAPTAGSAIEASVAAPSYDFICEVQSVTDGDTIRCKDGTRVRLHAIAARERDNTCSAGHPCPSASYEDSKAALERLAGRRLTCDRTGTSYERVTAICQNSSGVEVNCAMVRSGAAAIWDRFNRERAICRS